MAQALKMTDDVVYVNVKEEAMTAAMDCILALQRRRDVSPRETFLTKMSKETWANYDERSWDLTIADPDYA